MALVPRWVGLSVAATDRVRTLRDTLYSHVKDADFRLERSPHITVFGEVGIPSRREDELRSLLDTRGLEGRTVTVTGIRAHPSWEEPRFVVLDVELGLTQDRSRLAATIRSMGGEVISVGASPHITLFKGGRTGEPWPGVAPSVAERLRTATRAVAGGWTTTVERIRVEQPRRARLRRDGAC